MAIDKNITPGLQMELNRWSCTTTATIIKQNKETDVKDFCLCHYECDYKELAFTNLNDTSNTYKNDYRKFLLTPQDVGGTYEFLLVDSSGVETPIDETLGEVYAQGFNSAQPLQTGVNVLWWKVAMEKGYGEYKVKTNLTQFGRLITSESHTFIVAPFNTDRADGTVKIEIVNKGITMNGVNWDGLGDFINMVRVSGELIVGDLEKETETTITTQRVEVDYQSTTRKTYSVTVENVPSSIGNVITDEGALMGWFVTDYNTLNYNDYRDVSVKIDSVSVPHIANYSKRFITVGLKATEFKVNRSFV